jgi:hypothetical protein
MTERYDIRQDWETGLYRVVDTANGNAPVDDEQIADRAEAVRKAERIERQRNRN